MAINWFLFVRGVTTDRTLDATLGYFFNPLIAAFVGVAVLGERLGWLHWAAFGVPGVGGLCVETAAVAPVAVGYLGWLVVASGPLTAIPLLLFAAAAKRIRLVTLAMIQYLAPIGQILVGWLDFGEPMPLERWIGVTRV